VSPTGDSAGQFEWVTVAVLGRTRGNRGELTATSFSSRPERFRNLREVYLFGDGRRAEVETAWFHEGRLILKFRGVDSISEAERLVGFEVRIPRGERVALEAGEYFVSELIGCRVEERDGTVLGRVRDWQEYGGPPLLELENGMLIPFARSICVEIDPGGGRIVVELPEGLKELNAS